MSTHTLQDKVHSLNNSLFSWSHTLKGLKCVLQRLHMNATKCQGTGQMWADMW